MKPFEELKCSEIIDMSLDDFIKVIEAKPPTLGMSISLRKYLTLTYEQLVEILKKLNMLVSSMDKEDDSAELAVEKSGAQKTIDGITCLLFNLEIKCMHLVKYEKSLKIGI